jgi:hypothetical protein
LNGGDGCLVMHSEPKCANCGIVIRWQPTVVDGRVYCCLGCAHGGPCECDYDNLPRRGEIQVVAGQSVPTLPMRKRASSKPQT